MLRPYIVRPAPTFTERMLSLWPAARPSAAVAVVPAPPPPPPFPRSWERPAPPGPPPLGRTGVASGRRRATSAPSGTRNLGPTPLAAALEPSRSLKYICTPVPLRTRLMNRLRGRLENEYPPP